MEEMLLDNIQTKVKSLENRYDNLQNLKENKEGLRKVSQSFESIFINMMFKEMRRELNESEGLFPKSMAQKFYEEMLDEELSKEMAQKDSLGISNAIFRTYGKYLGGKEIKNGFFG